MISLDNFRFIKWQEDRWIIPNKSMTFTYIFSLSALKLNQKLHKNLILQYARCGEIIDPLYYKAKYLVEGCQYSLRTLYIFVKFKGAENSVMYMIENTWWYPLPLYIPKNYGVITYLREL